MQKKISVIIPIFNPPIDLFESCLKSILSQKVDIDIILIDNGSDDYVKKVIENIRFEDGRVISYRFEENKGFSGACNKGIELVKTEYFMIVDSDDMLEEGALEILESELGNSPDIVVFQHSTLNEKTKIKNKFKYPQVGLKSGMLYKLDEIGEELFLFTKCVWNKCFKTNFVKDNGLKFNIQIPTAGPDVLFTCESMLVARKIKVIKEDIYVYRTEVPGSVMSKLKKNKEDYEQLYHFSKELLNFCENQQLNKESIEIALKVIPEIFYFNYKIANEEGKFKIIQVGRKFFENTSIQKKWNNYFERSIYYTFVKNKFGLSASPNSSTSSVIFYELKKRGQETNILTSILVPIYNHPDRYVRKCLESLSNQTFDNYEVILLDNGATIENKLLIGQFLSINKKFKSIHMRSNIGYGAALNKGLDLTRGKYLGIVESDDFVEPNFVESLTFEAEERDLDIVKAAHYFHTELSGDQEAPTLRNSGRVLTKEGAKDLILGPCSYWTALYRKEVILENGIKWLESEGATGQDVVFQTMFWSVAKRIEFVPLPLYHYRVDNDNQSIYKVKENSKNLFSNFEAIRKFINSTKQANELIKVVNTKELKNILFFLDLLPVESIGFYSRAYKRIQCILKELDYLREELDAKEALALENFDKFIFKKCLKKSVLQKNNLGNYKRVILFSLIRASSFKGYKNLKFARFEIFKQCEGSCQSFKNCKYFGGILRKEEAQNKYNYFFFNNFLFSLNKLSTKFEKLIQSINSYTQYKTNSDKKDLLNFITYNNEIIRRINDTEITGSRARKYHPDTFKKFCGVNEGKEVALVACGPTASKHEQIQNVVYCGVNRAFKLTKINFSYLFTQDDLGQDIEDFFNYKLGECNKFLGFYNMNISDLEKKDFHPVSFIEYLKNKDKVSPYFIKDDFSTIWPIDISDEPLLDNHGTVFSAMQFLLYTNPKKIYLVGCDCSDGGHFYGGKEENFSVFIDQWKKIKLFCSIFYPKTEIISINPVGLKGMFKDIYID